MLIAFHGLDRPDAGDLRDTLRSAHADYQHHRGNPVGGPLLDDAGNACGTLIIFEADSVDAAERLMADDPFVAGGLFAQTSIREFVAIDWPTAPGG